MEERHAGFKRRLIGCNLTHTRTAEEAIAALGNDKFDYVFLDHDLGGEVFVASDKGTGYEVVQWICRHPDKISGSQIIVHSYNFAGATNMVKELGRNGIKSIKMPYPCVDVCKIIQERRK